MVRAVIFDLDGTIYEGSKVIDGALDTVNELRRRGKKVLFMTNNSSKTRAQICDKLNSMGISCCVSDIYSSGSAVASYLKENSLNDVYVFGSESLRSEISGADITVTDDEHTAQVTVIGLKTDVCYDDFSKCVRAAIRSNVLIACNLDRTYPGANGILYPGCGYQVSSVEWCSEKKSVCIGKPNTIMLDILCRENDLDKSDIIVVGDSYESDIQTAINYSVRSILIGHDERTIFVDMIKDILNLII